VLSEYCLPLCRVGGRVFAPKGSGGALEAHAAADAIERLGGRVASVEAVELPGVDPRTLVIVAKERRTPAEFPRAPGVPGKDPL
jgi:16S rRNA (guanine527-N7)-methyltransferase